MLINYRVFSQHGRLIRPILIVVGLMVLLQLVISTSRAAQPSQPAKVQTVNSKTNEQAVSAATNQGNPASTTKQTIENKDGQVEKQVIESTDETFVPSEEISEDLAVSFPVDI